MVELQPNNEAKKPEQFARPGEEAGRKRLLHDTDFGHAGTLAMEARRGTGGGGTPSEKKSGFYDMSGKEVDPKKVTDNQPLYSVSLTDKGAVINYFQDAGAALSNRPSAREVVTKTTDGNRVIESKAFYVIDDSLTLQRAKQSELSLDKSTGNITLETIDSTGREDKITFDENGQALSLTINRQDGSFQFTLKDGQPIKVTRDGQELCGEAEKLELQKAEVALAAARKELGLAKPSADVVSDLRPTSIDTVSDKEGKPTGTLVFRAVNGLFTQARVDNGIIKDESGSELGSVTNAGKVTLKDGRKFDIANTEGAAFHGIGSDGKRLDLVPEDSRTGFNGTFVSPDKKESIAIIGNYMYDREGKFVGYLQNDGSVERPSTIGTDYQAINSFRDGWTFEGEENGKKRIFTTSSETVNGKIFIPEKPGAPPTRYDVSIGMLINHETGEQCGWVSSPRERADGTLEGGSIVRMTENGIQEVPLAAFKNAVFEFNRIGETGLEGTAIQGIARGAEVQADGELRAGEGFFSISGAVRQESRRAAKAQNNLNDLRASDGASNYRSWTGAQAEAMALEQGVLNQTKENSRTLLAVLNTGEVNPYTLESLERIRAGSEVILAGGHLQASRNRLDHPQSRLEALPEDMGKLNGQVMMRREDGSMRTCQIRGGKLFDANSAQPDEPIGAILANDGTMVMKDDRSGKLITTAIKYIPGATWHFDLPDGKSCDWISLGQAGIASKADLIDRSTRELSYANAVRAHTQSDDSLANLAETTQRRQQYLRRLDAIFSGGVRSNEDLTFVADGPVKYVRSEQLQAQDAESPKRIELPPLNTQEQVATVNGDLRIGEQVYFIRNGELFHRSGSASEPAPGERACGKLLPGYRVALGENEADQRVLSLADQNRVLLQFTANGSSEQHQIVGLGIGRQTWNQGFLNGGLLDVKELDRQAQTYLEQAGAGNSEYIRNTPYFTGAIGEVALENRGEMLQQFVRDVSRNRSLLNENLDTLFANGFDASKMQNANMDNSVRFSQALLHCMGTTAADTESLSREGQKIQEQVNNGVTMIAITVATAGVGSVFSGLATTARVVQLGRVGQGLMLAGELTSSALVGGTVSTIMRASDSSSASQNFQSGFIEGGLMAIGSMGLRAVGGSVKKTQEALKIARAGGTLSAEQARLLTSVTGRLLANESENAVAAAYAVQGAYRVTNAGVQSTGYAVAGNLRQGNNALASIDAQSIMVGTLTNLAGDVVGNRLSQVMRNEFSRSLVENAVSGFSSGTLDGIQPALQEQDRAIAARLGVPVSWLSEETKRKHRDWGAILEQAAQTGAMNAWSSPFVTGFSHLSSAGGHALVAGTQHGEPQARPRPNPSRSQFRVDAGHDAASGPRTRPGSETSPATVRRASTDSDGAAAGGRRVDTSDGRVHRIDSPDAGGVPGPHINRSGNGLAGVAMLPELVLVGPAAAGDQGGNPRRETVNSDGSVSGDSGRGDGTDRTEAGREGGASKPDEGPAVVSQRPGGGDTTDASGTGTNQDAPVKQEVDRKVDQGILKVQRECPPSYLDDIRERGQKPSHGDEGQQKIFEELTSLLNEKQPGNKPSLAEQGWRIYQPAKDSAADAAKMDFILVNENNGDYYFIDATEKKGESGTKGGKPISELHEDALIVWQTMAAKDRTDALRARINQIMSQRPPLNVAEFPPPFSTATNADPDATIRSLRGFVNRLKDNKLGGPGYEQRREYAIEIERAIHHHEAERAKQTPVYQHYNQLFGQRADAAVEAWVNEFTADGRVPNMRNHGNRGPRVGGDEPDTIVWGTRLNNSQPANLEYRFDRQDVSRRVETAIEHQLERRRRELRAVVDGFESFRVSDPRVDRQQLIDELQARIERLDDMQRDWRQNSGRYLNNLGDFVVAELRQHYKNGTVAEGEQAPTRRQSKPSNTPREQGETVPAKPAEVVGDPRLRHDEQDLADPLRDIAELISTNYPILRDNAADPEVLDTVELFLSDDGMRARYGDEKMRRIGELFNAYRDNPAERLRLNDILRTHQENREQAQTGADRAGSDATAGSVPAAQPGTASGGTAVGPVVISVATDSPAVSGPPTSLPPVPEVSPRTDSVARVGDGASGTGTVGRVNDGASETGVARPSDGSPGTTDRPPSVNQIPQSSDTSTAPTSPETLAPSEERPTRPLPPPPLGRRARPADGTTKPGPVQEGTEASTPTGRTNAPLRRTAPPVDQPRRPADGTLAATRSDQRGPQTASEERQRAQPLEVARPAQQPVRRKETASPCTVHRDVDGLLTIAATLPDLQGHKIKDESRPDMTIVRVLEGLSGQITHQPTLEALMRTLREYKAGNEATVEKVNQFFNWQWKKNAK